MKTYLSKKTKKTKKDLNPIRTTQRTKNRNKTSIKNQAANIIKEDANSNVSNAKTSIPAGFAMMKYITNRNLTLRKTTKSIDTM